MSHEYSAQLLRDHDYDRYVLTLCAPARVRPALWAVFAFHHEINRTRFMVSEPTLGLIRLQWWRDVCVTLANAQTPPAHPVVEALYESFPITQRAELSTYLQALVDAYEDLWQQPRWNDEAGFVRFVEKSATALDDLVVLSTNEKARAPYIWQSYILLEYLRSATMDEKRTGMSAYPSAWGDHINTAHHVERLVKHALSQGATSITHPFILMLRHWCAYRLELLTQSAFDRDCARFRVVDPLLVLKLLIKRWFYALGLVKY